MRRRTLITSASAAALSLIGTGPALTQSPCTLRFGYVLSEDSPLGVGGKVFEAEVARRTGGRYKIEHYPNAALGGEGRMLKEIQHGSLDLAFITAAPLPNFVLETGVFSIPFMFDSASHAREVLDGPVGVLLLEKFRDQDLVALAWGETGMRQLTNSKRAIRTPDDLKGLKLGMPQSAVMMMGFEAFGADVNATTLPELFSALQSGRLDGQENPVTTIQAAKLWQVQQHLTLSNHSYDPAVIFMSPAVHGALSAADQQAFAEAARLAALASRSYAAEAHAHGVEFLSQAGMQVVREIDRTQFMAAMEPAKQKFDKLLGEGLVGWVHSAG